MTEAAQAYEALFVPALFEQWTRIVAELAQIRRGERVLDVACGTGVLAPRRRLVVAVWDALEKNPAYAAAVDLLARLAGRPAADALGTARFPSVRVVLEADLRGWLPMVGITLSEDTIPRVLAAGDGALAGCVSQVPLGVEFDLSAHIVSASH
jgi:SAM-dependent methyltransferase